MSIHPKGKYFQIEHKQGFDYSVYNNYIIYSALFQLFSVHLPLCLRQRRRLRRNRKKAPHFEVPFLRRLFINFILFVKCRILRKITSCVIIFISCLSLIVIILSHTAHKVKFRNTIDLIIFTRFGDCLLKYSYGGQIL